MNRSVDQTLEWLDMVSCDIKERGSFVIADMLKENTALKMVILNDNPIGQRGGRAVLRGEKKRHNKITYVHSLSRSVCVCVCE
eukprot:COSAG05_NODE_825_length_7106_cov_74.690881_11_plen_83_part_00